MANEATLIIETGPPINMTVYDGTGLEKGTILNMRDPLTVSGNSAVDDVVGGIAAEEKISGDGKTKLGVYREGVFKVTLSGTCTVGDGLAIGAAANDVYSPTSFGQTTKSNWIGIALETGTDNETILMELKPVTVNQA